MKKKTGIWLIIGFLFFAFLIYFSWQRFGPTEASAKILSKQAAQKLVQDRYQGTVIQINLTDKQYHIDLEKKDTIYQIELNAISGKVLSFVKKESKSPPLNEPEVTFKSEDEIRKIILAKVKGTITSFEKIVNEDETIYKAVVKEGNNQTTLSVDALTGKILSSITTQTNTSSRRLTEKEARDIAKKQVNGIVEHIWLETKGEQTYYLVEIETQDDREAIVQIHSITGNVMSISWDDRSSDDDDEKSDDSKQRDKDDKKEDDD